MLVFHFSIVVSVLTTLRTDRLHIAVSNSMAVTFLDQKRKCKHIVFLTHNCSKYILASTLSRQVNMITSSRPCSRRSALSLAPSWAGRCPSWSRPRSTHPCTTDGGRGWSQRGECGCNGAREPTIKNGCHIED